MKAGKYYVYELADPRDERVFYVGKGCGNRVSQHVKDAKKGAVGLKSDFIREILEEPICEVIERIVRRFDDEDKAYACEKRLIAKYGLENLANIAEGGRSMTSAEFHKRRAARDRVPHLARWIRVIAGKSPQSKGLNLLHSKMPNTLPRAVNCTLTALREIFGASETAKMLKKYNIFIESRVQENAV